MFAKFYSKVRNGKTLNQNKSLHSWSYHILKVKVSMPFSLITIAAQSLIKSFKSLYCVSILKSYSSWAMSFFCLGFCLVVMWQKCNSESNHFYYFYSNLFKGLKGPKKTVNHFLTTLPPAFILPQKTTVNKFTCLNHKILYCCMLKQNAVLHQFRSPQDWFSQFCLTQTKVKFGIFVIIDIIFHLSPCSAHYTFHFFTAVASDLEIYTVYLEHEKALLIQTYNLYQYFIIIWCLVNMMSSSPAAGT